MQVFFLGVHDLVDAQKLNSRSSCISLARILDLNRKSDFVVEDWILDAGTYGFYNAGKLPLCPWLHALLIQRWSKCGNLLAAVSWDWLCLPHIRAKTGLTVRESQVLTVQRYELLLSYLQMMGCNTYLMPVLQGETPQDYRQHIRDYGDRLVFGQWVGVGSLKGRSVYDVEQILFAVHKERPDLRLHGFGLTETTLKSSFIWDLVYSADSQAWEMTARWAKIKTGNRDKLSFAKSLTQRVSQRHSAQLSIFAKTL